MQQTHFPFNRLEASDVVFHLILFFIESIKLENCHSIEFDEMAPIFFFSFLKPGANSRNVYHLRYCFRAINFIQLIHFVVVAVGSLI